MFGYVRARRDELTVKNDALYRAAYCGLCKEMGRCTGQCSRLTLSYDTVFLYLVRSAVKGELPTVKKGRCMLHPLKSRPVVCSSDELKYAACVSSLLVYGKLCDDISDEKGMKRLSKKLLKPFANSFKRRAALDDLYEKIENSLDRLCDIEESRLESVDAPAEVFGELMREVFAYGLENGEAAIAGEIGFRVGRFIYAVDAADDIDADKKSGSYNPFLLLYGDDLDESYRKTIELGMKYDLSLAGNATDLIDDSDILQIVKNIIYLGMSDAMHTAIFKKTDKGENGE